jgi:hypothetical protein
MKRKRTIANLLQETNNSIRVDLVETPPLALSKRTDSFEKKTFVKEYFEGDTETLSVGDNTAVSGCGLDIQQQTDFITQLNQPNNSNHAADTQQSMPSHEMFHSKTISSLINQRKASVKKSKIKDYVFTSNDSSCSASSESRSTTATAEIIADLTTQSRVANVYSRKKTIGSMINTYRKLKQGIASSNVNSMNGLKTKEKKSKIKDYIQTDTFLTGSSSNDTPSKLLISSLNNINKSNEQQMQLNQPKSMPSLQTYQHSTKIRFQNSMKVYNKSKKNKIKDYIISRSNLTDLNTTGCMNKKPLIASSSGSSIRKRLSRTNSKNISNRKMNVKNHLQLVTKPRDLAYSADHHEPSPVSPVLSTTTTPTQTNKSTIKEYLQNKNQRNKLINNKENLNEIKMATRLYYTRKSSLVKQDPV